MYSFFEVSEQIREPSPDLFDYLPVTTFVWANTLNDSLSLSFLMLYLIPSLVSPHNSASSLRDIYGFAFICSKIFWVVFWVVSTSLPCKVGMYGISKKSQKFKELFGGIKIYPYICIKK